ncbi:MAG: SDR family oxidoreductase [Balneolales bacterium]
MEKPPQHQERKPGLEKDMEPKPVSEKKTYRGSDKLLNKVALITGGDSGIGRAIAIAFAKEGADVAISYLNEHEDADETRERVRENKRSCHLFPGDIGQEPMCRELVEKTVKEFGKIDILINNAAEHYFKTSIEEISEEQLEETFRTNVFSYFFLTKAALPHMKEGGSIINTTSVTAYEGNPVLLDYSATKGAVLSFTRALSQSLVKKGIRVNAVAPGPIWTPLIPATFPPEAVEKFGKNTPMGRAGQPDEVAPCYVFLASDEASYISGQVLHPNGGTIVAG